MLLYNEFQAEAQGSAACNPSKPDLVSNTACNVLYKPVAKLVSRTTVSLLSNLVSVYYGILQDHHKLSFII